ncbi:MAG: cation:proton antiporter [Actinobacteria bacterium]|nr:cation:proton antiporter [Actinomycetota bacterium]
MTLDTPELAHVLLALCLLLAAAHGCGYAMSRLRQPRVIGEIVGGLLLGPTVLGAVAPGAGSALFPPSGAVPAVLDAIYQLGLLFLMFTAGAEMRGFFHRRERRALTWISVVGMLLPFAAGLAVVGALPLQGLHGAAATDGAFVLVFGIAVAITSIPVISRIMLDLGILDTSFARIVLGVAVVEDVVLYILFAVALGLVAQDPGDSWGLPAILGIGSSGTASVAYHVVAELGFLGAMMAAGPWLYRKLSHRYNPVRRGNHIGFELVFVLSLSMIAMWLGVVPLLGAFVAGLVVSTSTGIGATRARESIKAFSFAFFIPVYFATVGLRLDLLREFSLVFFVPFFLFACVVKSMSVYAGARLGGEAPSTSRNLAVALNARGGPGIVLASVAFDARIISASFYSSLVMLAVLTSLIAGSWLGRIVRSGHPIREVADDRLGQDPPAASAG